MSFYQLPGPWDPGYVIPEYVMAEPPERGTFTTQWLPRGTISQLTPDFLVKPGKRLLGRNDAGLGSLGDDTLGTGVPPAVIGSGDGAVLQAAANLTAATAAAAAAAAAAQRQKEILVGAVIGGALALYFLPKMFKHRRRSNPARRRR